MILLILLAPFVAYSSINAEIGAYSDFIWRGTTFSENRPAIQGEVDAETEKGFFVSGFVSNAEFSDLALHENATVTSEVDVTVGKRWSVHNWDIQAYYSRFFFPGAGVFDTDEWNLQLNHFGVFLEFSLLDDYFGYHSRYTYTRIGYEWNYKENLDGALFIGYNSFDRAKGTIRTRGEFQTLDGAGNPDYVDIFFVNRKTLKNNHIAELALNWTDRKEYSVENGIITKSWAKDFALLVSYVIPFSL